MVLLSRRKAIQCQSASALQSSRLALTSTAALQLPWRAFVQCVVLDSIVCAGHSDWPPRRLSESHRIPLGPRSPVTSIKFQRPNLCEQLPRGYQQKRPRVALQYGASGSPVLLSPRRRTQSAGNPVRPASADLLLVRAMTKQHANRHRDGGFSGRILPSVNDLRSRLARAKEPPAGVLPSLRLHPCPNMGKLETVAWSAKHSTVLWSLFSLETGLVA